MNYLVKRNEANLFSPRRMTANDSTAVRLGFNLKQLLFQKLQKPSFLLTSRRVVP